MPHSDKEKQREYYQKYYKKKRDDILEKKREKYRDNEEYRKAVKEQATKRQKKTRVATTRRKRNAREPLPFKIFIFGKEVELKMYTLMQLSIALDKSIKTLRAWEDRGVLPKAIYRDTKGPFGNRLYPEFQFNLILEAYAKAILSDTKARIDTRVSKTSLPRRLKEIWDRYPKGIDQSTL